MGISEIIMKLIKEKKTSRYQVSSELGMSKSWLYNVLLRNNMNCDTLGRILEHFNLNLIAVDDLGIRTIFPNKNTGKAVLNYIDNERANQSMFKSKLGELCNLTRMRMTPLLNQNSAYINSAVRMGNALKVKFLIDDEQITIKGDD